MARSNSKSRKKLTTRDSLSAALNKLSTSNGASIRAKKNTSTKEIALTFVYAMGCTISSEKIDYSLLDEQTDKENIENENIDQSKKFSRIKTGKSLTSNKFANTSDPFYELDDELPERVKSVNASIATEVAPDLTNLALSLSAIG